jgi:ZIP family zinc transporter
MLLTVIVTTLLAGLAMPLGAIAASIEKINPSWLEEEFRHTVTAFGGGALLSAVALVLVPEGIAHQSAASASAFFIAGGIAFMMLDRWLTKHNTPASQLAAMLSDFIPESLALGAAFATGNTTAFLLAGLIGLQNLPDGLQG